MPDTKQRRYGIADPHPLDERAAMWHRAFMSDLVEHQLTTRLGEIEMMRASTADAAPILRLRDALAQWMVDQEIDQWRPGDMPLTWIEECAAHGWIFAARWQGVLVASITLVETDPFIWGERNAPAGYIHMLMVDRQHARLGLGRSLLEWAERRITRTGQRRARLDCVRTNAQLRAYYKDAGYALIGYHEFPGNIPSVAHYEKTLKD